MEIEKTTSIKISTHSPFQKLKAVAIGQGLSEDIFDWITEEKIKSPMFSERKTG